MKYYIVLTVTMFSFLFNTIIAQNTYDDFFLPFEVVGEKIEGNNKIFKVALLDQDIIIDQDEVGSIMPLYIPNSKNKVEYIGEVSLSESDSEVLFIKLENTDKNNSLLNEGKALIKIRASLGNMEYKSLAYHMHRLNIDMLDVIGEKDLLDEAIEDPYSSLKGSELVMLEKLVEESGYVGGEMRKQMDSPKINEGRFKPSDLFTAMEIADSWDVRSFLMFVKKHPFKYQGEEWKFSEIFATWMIEGAPTTFEDLKELGSTGWKEDTYLVRFFEDVPLNLTKKVLDEIRSEAGGEIDADNFARAELLLDNVFVLAESIDDEIEMAWTNYKKAKLLSQIGDDEAAIVLYEKTIASFEKEKEEAGLLIAKNDIGYSYNELGGKSNYKKAVEYLTEAINGAEKFGKDDKVISPIIGLMYRNISDSYFFLDKSKKSLEALEIGLTYTNFSTPIALKRRASILLEMSETYGEMGKKKLQEEYLNKSIMTYKEYETVLDNIKKI